MRPDDRIRLLHIADALDSVARFIEGCSREDLDKNAMLSFALMHAIQIVGEAARKISQETRDRYPQIPWADVIGMRRRLVHNYIDVDPGILWETVTVAAPVLLTQVRSILEAS